MTEAETPCYRFDITFEEVIGALNAATRMDLDHDAGADDVSHDLVFEGVARAMEQAGLSHSAAQALSVPEGRKTLEQMHSPGFYERVTEVFSSEDDLAQLYASAEWAGFTRGLMVGLIAAGIRTYALLEGPR
jgi:hypothetical protein